jgi:hypothetical protein
MLGSAFKIRQSARAGLAVLGNGLLAYLATTFLVALGILLGLTLLREAGHSRSPQRVALTGNRVLDCLTQWDGQWYSQIATRGYTFDPNRHSSPAFFPLYPLLGRLVADATGLDARIALLVVSHVFLAGAFVVMFAYARERYPLTPCPSPEAGEGSLPEATDRSSRQVAAYVVLAFGLFPTMMFGRVAYSESLFVFLSVLAMYGMLRRWPAVAVALVIGLATAARSVGVALVLPFVLYVWRESGSRWQSLARLVYLTPLALWGLLAHVVMLGVTLGEPLAFAKTQTHWRMRPESTWSEQLAALAAWEPIWSVYDPSSVAYWRRYGDNPAALFSLQAANPVYFVMAAALVVFGAAKRWLLADEVLLAAALLLVPYLFRAHPMCMTGQGRFVGAVFPIFLTLGNLLCRIPLVVGGGMLALSAVFLAVYSAMFAAGYFFI